jgi:RanBP1 domain
VQLRCISRARNLKAIYSGLVLTGEEEDETVHSVRGKLFVLSEHNQWKERGTGLLRLNRRRVDHGGARLGELTLVILSSWECSD